jgi:hypothetical protein
VIVLGRIFGKELKISLVVIFVKEHFFPAMAPLGQMG